jgi:hypothetical protein
VVEDFESTDGDEPVIESNVLDIGPRRHTMKYIAAGLVLVLVVAAVLIGTSGSGNSSAGAAVIVRKALASTLATNSLAFNLSENVDLGGQGLTVTGTGACDLTSGDCVMTMNYAGVLSSDGPIDVVYSGGVAYLKFAPGVNTKIATPWISTTLNTTSSSQLSPLGGESPLSGLSLLARQGAVVTDEGTVQLNGVTMHTYKVVVSPSAEKKILSNSNSLPVWVNSNISTANIGPVTEMVDVNSAGELAQMSADTSVSSGGASATVSLTFKVTGYGVPVTVTVPPANQVTSITSASQLSNG